MIVQHLPTDIDSVKDIVNISWKSKIKDWHLVEAVRVPEWSNGVDCKSIVREFESHPALKYGAVAQLGERLPCTEEVAGSTPVSSTIAVVAQLINHN